MINANDAKKRTDEQCRLQRLRAEEKARLDKQHWLDDHKSLIADSLAFVEDCINGCIVNGIYFELFAFVTSNVDWKKIYETSKSNYRFRAPWLAECYIENPNDNINLFAYAIKPALIAAGYNVDTETTAQYLTLKVSWK